jgi:hypothetical protein
MDPEPPPDYVEFVAGCLPVLHDEATRLVGGSEHADEVSTEALTDIAGQWRRLQWRSRLTRRDAPAEVLRRRLAVRAKQWRDDQIYEVDVQVGSPPAEFGPETTAFEPVRVGWSTAPPATVSFGPSRPVPAMAGRGGAGSLPPVPALRTATPRPPAPQSVARRLAPLVDPTVRPQARPTAEAAIAWVHAYRRHKWHQFARVATAVFVVTALVIRVLSALSPA